MSDEARSDRVERDARSQAMKKARISELLKLKESLDIRIESGTVIFDKKQST